MAKRTPLLCRVFGHNTTYRGWWGDGLYGKVVGGSKDGCGRTHYRGYLPCRNPGCTEEVLVFRFHGHQTKGQSG